MTELEALNWLSLLDRFILQKSGNIYEFYIPGNGCIEGLSLLDCVIQMKRLLDV